MLWAFLALYLFGSSGTTPLAPAFDHARASIKTEVPDSSRRAELLALMDEAERATREFVKERKRATWQIERIVRAYETKPADIEPLMRELRAQTERYQAQVIRTRFELKSKMSREEWAIAFPR